MADAYRVQPQNDLIKVKLVKLKPPNTSIRTECLPMDSAVNLEISRSEPERIDEIVELEDDDMEENDDDEEEEEMDDNSTNSGARKKKHLPFIFSIKQRRWFMENYTYSPNPKAFVTKEEIASEYSKAHPEIRPMPKATVGKIVKMIWGNKVRCTRRKLNIIPEDNQRKPVYMNLTRKIIHQDQAAKLSESVFSLPLSELLTPGWTVEMFLHPFGIRYQKRIQQFYVDKHPAMLEVYFSMFDEHAEVRSATTDVERSCYPIATHSAIKDSNSGNSCSNSSGSISSTEKHSELERNDNTNYGNDAIEGDNEKSCNPSGIDSAINNSNSTSTNANSGTSNTYPVRTLCANILCSGRLISAEELDIWDNKSVPTLGKVKTLLEVLDNSEICFGFDVKESWRSVTTGSDCSLNPKEKVVVVHKSFDDILLNKGQRKLISTDCKILVSALLRSCVNCLCIFKAVNHRETRSQKFGNKISLQKNHNKMTRAELEEKIKRQNAELCKYRTREKWLEKKLSEVNCTDSEESTDSESSADEEEAESEI